MRIVALSLATSLILLCAAGCVVKKDPAVDFTSNISSGTVPFNLQFTDTSDTAKNEILSWLWTFGDGATSDMQNPIHQYQVAGIYEVSLTLTTKKGGFTTTKAAFVVAFANPDPTVDFTSDVADGVVPFDVQFTDTSLKGDDDILAWHWDFGDGTTADVQNPAHQYVNAGTYDVSLTLTTAESDFTTTKAGFITAHNIMDVAQTVLNNEYISCGSGGAESTLIVDVDIDYRGAGPLLALGATINVPLGWKDAKLAEVTNLANPDGFNFNFSTGTLLIYWVTMPTFPAHFSYLLTVPSGESGDKTLAVEGTYFEDAGSLSSPVETIVLTQSATSCK